MSHDIPSDEVEGPPVGQTEPPPRATPVVGRTVPIVLASAVAGVLILGGALVYNAESKVNKVALSASAKPVSVIAAKATPFQPSRTYVGTLEPWLSARIGPQLVSADQSGHVGPFTS